MSFHKIPNSATTATSSNHPNTIMLRDSDGASRVSSLIMKGVDFLKECVSSSLLTKGYIYFSSNTHNKNYALLRNAEMNNNEIHLSLDFGQNNKCGNFSIRTEQQTNFIVKNNRVGINQCNPVSTLDVSGTMIVSDTFISNGPIIANSTINISSLSQGGPIYATSTGQLQLIRPFHIVDASANVPFTTNTMFVLEIYLEIILPQNMYDGYTLSIINKCGETTNVASYTDNMFSAFYLPNGGTHFSLEPNRKIELTYCRTTLTLNSSWVFNTF
jgi:hypothetical protein